MRKHCVITAKLSWRLHDSGFLIFLDRDTTLFTSLWCQPVQTSWLYSQLSFLIQKHCDDRLICWIKGVQLGEPIQLLFCSRDFDFNISLYSFLTADVGLSTTTEPLLTFLPPINTTYSPAPSTTQDPLGYSITALLNSTETDETTTLSNTSSVPYNSSDALQWTSSAPYTSMSSTVESPLPATTCCKKYFIFISGLLAVKYPHVIYMPKTSFERNCLILLKALNLKWLQGTLKC